ncbi:ABC transporter permease [Actinorugispora endophytica]|uniref:Transport permease protein n=1 Tax=Actinorugispora endophytica TaxID=1605990 RepID=A0A4R6UZF3_9ACTN|nr:ABC transporter permease [Actinorugispora endophytica]TDQ52966.1 ABC-2 type transport system permease protein [Actinorugispora endophytica]
MKTRTRLRHAAADSLTMVERSLRHMVRDVDSLLLGVILPVVLLLMFVYVFGGAIDPGTGYLDYVVPGIILVCAGYGAASTSVAVATDLAEGIVDRFRSMPILSSAMLTGHVVASTVRNVVSMVIVIGVALLMGFRPTAGPLEWLGAAGVLVLFMLAVSALAAVFGLVAKTPESAGAFPFFVLFLPYASSAFVPTDTMPGWLRWFAENQPVTPVIETVRALLVGGGPAGGDAVPAVAWFGGLLVLAQTLAVVLFRRRTAR